MDKWTNGRTDWVTTSLLELLIAAKNLYLNVCYICLMQSGASHDELKKSWKFQPPSPYLDKCRSSPNSLINVNFISFHKTHCSSVLPELGPSQPSLLSKILEIWYPILFCLYLGSLISYRKVFVLHMVLWNYELCPSLLGYLWQEKLSKNCSTFLAA